MSAPRNDCSQERFPILQPTLQIGFHARLSEARSETLLPALLEFVSTADIECIDSELREFAGPDKLKMVAGSGLRGELVYPVPYVLRARPVLLAYYRLLLGFSQKEFYNKGPFGCFAMMESHGRLSSSAVEQLPELCRSLIESAWVLVNGIPELSQEVLSALTLLTLGAQYCGSYNALLGQRTTKQVFALIRDIVERAIGDETDKALVIQNAAGQRVRIELAPDPDIAIREELGSGRYNQRIAIELKGGRDVSNIHNRLGEAEKSHLKARQMGFSQCWTLVGVSTLDSDLAERESPSTSQFFLIAEIINDSTDEHMRFRELLTSELGITS